MMNIQTPIDAPSTVRSLFWPLAIVLALLLGLLLLMGYGPGGSACAVDPMTTAKAPIPPTPVTVTEPSAPPSPVGVETPVPAPEAPPRAERLYFAFNSAVVDAADRGKVAPIVEYLKAHPNAKAIISGFHDPRGASTRNAELALSRARAVFTVLEEQGIAQDRVEMTKPLETTGDGSPREARRAEIRVQP